MCEVARNLPAIESWRSTLPNDELLELNHPRVVLTHWKRSLRCADEESEKSEVAETNPLFEGWKKSSPEQRTAGLGQIRFEEFRVVMPDAWCKPIKDCAAHLLAEDRNPDFRITRAVQKALDHIAIADDAKTSKPVAQSHEKEARDELRVVLKALQAINRQVRDLDVGTANPKAKRRSS